MNLIERFNSHWTPEPYSGCWLWEIANDKDGYGLFKSEHGIQRRAHRFSWEIYRGEIPKGAMVLHHCDVRSCVNPNHLYLGTGSDNMQDRSRRGGLNQYGERNPSVKLTEADVHFIRQSIYSLNDLAKMLGVCKTTVSYIRRRKLWPHI